MLSFYEKYGDIFHDVLLTQADAEQLYKELGQAIESNKAKP